MSANTKTRYGSQNKYLPAELVEINLALERIMQWNKWSLTITQGSWSGSVSASAGTHSGADGQDLTPNDERNKEKFLRILGCMHYIRPALRGVWSRHSHGGRDYSTGGSRGFKQQLAAYHRRRNALANNGPDTGYRMTVFPKHVYKGYIGYVQATKACHAWEQQTNKSKKLNACKKSQITYVVAETEVAGKRWYVTLTGKCIYAPEWKKIAQPKGATPQKPDVQPVPIKKTVDKTIYEVVPKDLYGKDAPSWDAKTVETVHKGDKITGAFASTNSSKEVWIQNIANKWFAKKHLKVRTSTPPPPKPDPIPKSVLVKLGTHNVIRWRMGDSVRGKIKDWKEGLKYESRVPLIAQDVKDAKLSFLATQEQGQYKDCELIAKTLGGWDWIMHGDAAGDITQGNLNDKKVLRRLKEGKFLTAGSSHNYAVYTQYEVIATKEILWVCNLHLWYKAGGTSPAGNKEDKLRGEQTEASIVQMERIAGKDAVIVFTGDFNSAKENACDAPGRMMVAKGYVDAENYSASVVNQTYNSYFGATSPKNQKQIDRFFIKKIHINSGKIVIEQHAVTVNSKTRKGSDHYQVTIHLSIRTK